MPVVSSQGIFLSYRREDAAPYARLLHAHLREHLPGAQVFIDLDSIEAGLDFAEVIGEAVGSCAVLVALIGHQWATLTDEEGHRRLDNPDDLVRFEVQAALDRGVRVIPVLVDGARPLRQEQLPAELRKLARLNALELSYGRYEYDADRLLGLIKRVLGTASGTRIASEPSPTVNAETLAVSRREIYDRFLTSAQTLLIACEAARESKPEGAKASVETAHTKFFEAYSVVQTVADNALVDASRVYAYRLLELKASLDSTSVMGPENFNSVAQLIRAARHDTIDAMRAELGLTGSVRLTGEYNPFAGTALEKKYAEGQRPRPGSAAEP